MVRRKESGTRSDVEGNRPHVSLVSLFDVDNTLLDNDRIIADLQRYLDRVVGSESTQQYFKIFKQLRAELGYADYLGALQRYRLAYPRDPCLLSISSYLVNYPFANRLFPESLDVLERFREFGPTVILSDGDVVFQPRKIERSGLADAVEGRILVYIHKEQELDDVAARYPAEHYLMVDDKLHLLAAIKQHWASRVTTVFVRQGHYAHDPKILASNPPADVTIERIGDLLDCEIAMLRNGGTVRDSRTDADRVKHAKRAGSDAASSRSSRTSRSTIK